MSKPEHGDSRPESGQGRNVFEKVLAQGMASSQEESDEERKEHESARRILNHLFALSQEARMWNLEGEHPVFDWSQAPVVVKELAEMLKREQRRLSEREERLLIALAHAYNLVSDTSGVGDILAAFSFGREQVVAGIIEKMKEQSPSADYLQAVEALGYRFRPPITL